LGQRWGPSLILQIINSLEKGSIVKKKFWKKFHWKSDECVLSQKPIQKFLAEISGIWELVSTFS
jgi:hypothetical protein